MIMGKAYALKILMEVIGTAVTEERLKEIADYLLDKVEDMIESTPNTVDDKLILPVCAIVRRAFGIEDNDEE